jgi:acyl carrier protein
MQDTKAVVRRFLVDNIVMGADAQIGDETSFIEDHILDSTGFIELITFIEEAFGITVSDEEMLPENFDSLRNIDGYVARKRAATAPA